MNHTPVQPNALPACSVCSKPEGIIPQGPDRALCLSCALGSAQIESKRPDPAAPGGMRLALAGDLLDLAVPLWILKLQQLDDEAFESTWRQWLDEAEPSGVFSEVNYPGLKAPGLAPQSDAGGSELDTIGWLRSPSVGNLPTLTWYLAAIFRAPFRSAFR